MPIPTDTFWNTRRLHIAFAITAVLLMGTFGWAILQDYGKTWRAPQRDGRNWEAALTDEKLSHAITDSERKRLTELQPEIDAASAALLKNNAAVEKQQATIRDLTSQIADLSFNYNNDKAVVTVDEGKLEAARTAGDNQAADGYRARLNKSRPSVEQEAQTLAEKKDVLKKAKTDLDTLTKDRDDLQKQKTKLLADQQALTKKIESLAPKGLLANVSEKVRAMPLMGFINPAEKPIQDVLPEIRADVAFMKIATVDRCRTCHVHIERKEFSEANVLVFLERQLAQTRGLKLPTDLPKKSTDPSATADRPGAVAMSEFWLGWSRQMAIASLRKQAARLKTLADSVGTKADVTYDGHPLEKYSFDPDATDSTAVQKQNAIFSALLQAWAMVDPKDGSGPGVDLQTAHVKVHIHGDLKPAVAGPLRFAALRLPEDLRSAIETGTSHDGWGIMLERYRRAMTADVNVARRKIGEPPLDDSPVQLAHPNLPLYVDVDSKHSFESIGCTSCHDGSGQETNFVLAAHMPRRIWVDEKTGEPVLPWQLSKPPKEKGGITLSSMLAAIYPEDAIFPSKAHLLELDPAKPAAEADATLDLTKIETAPDGAEATAYVNPVTGQQGRAVPQGRYWAEKYEAEAGRSFELVYHEWDWPMRPREYLQANCVRCHQKVTDIREHAPVVYEGRTLFAQLGCNNCHQMDSIDPTERRQVGTDLRHVTAKLSPEYINTWIWAPKAFRPTTKMPHFFMLENNSSDEELRRTRQEARAITEYLVQTATPLPPKYTPPSDLKGNADNGLKLFTSIGCQACHTNLNNPSAKKGVTIGHQWIVQDLVKKGALAHELEKDVSAELVEAAKKDGAKPPTVDDIHKAAVKRAETEAEKIYAGMGYNERQLYVLENLEAPLLTSPDNQPKYPDGTLKPLFVHHGPELSGLGQKLTDHRTPEAARAWLFDWLKEPRHYSDYTVMPRLRLTDEQALDLAEYLLQQKRTNDGLDNDPWKAGLAEIDSPKLTELTALFLRSRYSVQKAVTQADDDAELTQLATEALTSAFGDTDRATRTAAAYSKDEKKLVFLGKKLIGHYGCMSCHAINGTKDLTSPCANLSDWGQKSVDKLDYGYLAPHRHEASRPQGADNLPPRPVQMVNGLSPAAGSLAHELPGGSWKSAISKPVECEWPEVEHSRTSWITQKLKNTRVWDRGRSLLEPRRKTDGSDQPILEGGQPAVTDPGHPYDKLRMPTFYLSDEQVHAIVTFVLSNRDRLISEKLADQTMNPRAQQIAYGRFLTQKYNCVNCHQIEENLPGVQQYFAADEIATKAPPSLRGEGNKIQHEWLFNFLRNVERLRPLPVIRMPSFPLEDSEATAIAAYFASVSNKEAEELNKQLDPIEKYIANAKELAEKAAAPKRTTSQLAMVAASAPTSVPTTAPAEAPVAAAPPAHEPGDDWWLQKLLEPARSSLTRWALDRKHINPIQIDPTKNQPAELEKNYKTILFKARFTAELYAAPFPFVDSIHPNPSDERFRKGEALFNEMQCLKCHVLQPTHLPEREGVIAPNLLLAHERLQRRWVRHWVQEPNVIQVGTAMPPFFTGLPVFKLFGVAWPASQGAEGDAVKAAEASYGTSAEAQAALLLDFIYAAGVRGYTAGLPAAPQTNPTTGPTTGPSTAATTQLTARPSTGPSTGPTSLPIGLPPTATQPHSAGDPSVGSPATAPVDKAPTTLPAADLKQETRPATPATSPAP